MTDREVTMSKEESGCFSAIEFIREITLTVEMMHKVDVPVLFRRLPRPDTLDPPILDRTPTRRDMDP
jgi:hypothetical protein